jgi:UDP-glucuronate 4-epimerase
MILITGCAGFIGYHLSKKLLQENFNVIGIDNLNNYYDLKLKKLRLSKLNRFKNFKFIKVDLCNFDKLLENTKKLKLLKIVHLAAQPGVRYSFDHPNKTLVNNLLSFSNIIEFARIKKINQFIYASSSSVYGNVKQFPFYEDDFSIKPISIYGASKLSNEIIADAYEKNYRLNCLGLRFFTVYGPYGRPDMAYYKFALDNLNNKKIKLYNKAKMLRDFTYIDDVIIAITKILDNREKFSQKILNIGKGKPDRLIDLVNYLQNNLDNKFNISYTNFIPKGDIKKTYSSNVKIKKFLNWVPKTSLNEGIYKFIIWFKKFHK